MLPAAWQRGLNRKSVAQVVVRERAVLKRVCADEIATLLHDHRHARSCKKIPLYSVILNSCIQYNTILRTAPSAQHVAAAHASPRPYRPPTIQYIQDILIAARPSGGQGENSRSTEPPSRSVTANMVLADELIQHRRWRAHGERNYSRAHRTHRRPRRKERTPRPARETSGRAYMA